MSKNLRVFLLSVLVIVLAASSAFANGILFKWTNKLNTSYWGEATNWTAYKAEEYRQAEEDDDPATDPEDEANVLTYDDVKDFINTETRLGASEFYPGKFRFADGSPYDYVDVLIDKDANIRMYQYESYAGLTVGMLQSFGGIRIRGNFQGNEQTAFVTIDMGNSYFAWPPNIEVDGGIPVDDHNYDDVAAYASLELKGTHVPAVDFTGNGNEWTWYANNGANFTLNFPVHFADSTKLYLHVDDGVLTIKDNSFIAVNGTGHTSIYVNDQNARDDALRTARLVLDIPGSPVNSGKDLDINFFGNANRIDALQPITLRVYSKDAEPKNVVNFARYTDDQGNFEYANNEEHTFVKGGASTLTLERLSKAAKNPVVSKTTAITVKEGTLALKGAGVSTLGEFEEGDDVPDFTVEKGASLDVGSRTVDTANTENSPEVHFVVKGNLIFRDKAVDAGDRYTLAGYNDNNRWLELNSNVTLDVRDGGVAHFMGDQGISSLTGSGTITSENGKILFLRRGPDEIKTFTGKLDNVNIAIVNNWDTIPFLGTNKKTTGRIGTIYVVGNNILTLDQAQLKSFGVTAESLDQTSIWLRSDRLGGNKEEDLLLGQVGALEISGDIILNELRIDGTKNAEGVAKITFDEDAYEDETLESSLKVNKLLIHANSDKDFNASNKLKDGTNIYMNVYAMIVNGKGQFSPVEFKNLTANDGERGVHVGTDNSVTIQNKTTLILGKGVEIPAHNSLALQGASLDVQNGTTIPGNFTIENYDDGDATTVEDANLQSYIYVGLTDSNDRRFEGVEKEGHRNAILVGGTMKVKTNNLIHVNVTSLVDPVKFLGKLYGIIGSMYSSDVSVVDIDEGAALHLKLEGYFTKDPGTLDDAIKLNYDKNGIYAQLVHWFIQPMVYDWDWLPDGDGFEGFGGADQQFAAWISYGISDDVTPDISQFIRPSLRISYKDRNAMIERLETGTLVAAVAKDTGRHRIYYLNTDTGYQEDIAYMEFTTSTDKNNVRKLIVSGTSYKTSLDIRVDLTWDNAGYTNWAAANGPAVVTYKVTTGGSLGQDGPYNFQNAPVKAVDLFNDLNDQVKFIGKHDPSPVESGDIHLAPDVVDYPNGVTFEAGDESSKFEFIIPGMTKQVITTSNAMPELVNGVYVWRNSATAEDVYTITTSEGEILTVKDVKVTVDGVEIPIASVDITNSGNGVLVSIPASLLGGAGDKEVAITATTDTGRKVYITTQHVTVKPAVEYQDGTVNEGEASVTFTNGGSEETHVVADVPLEGTISFDVSKGNNPAGLTWNNAGGVISYTLSPNIAPGTYNMVVLAYNENNQGYRYEFTVVVSEPVTFKVTVEDLYSDYYEGTNYVAYATAENVPEGEIAWTISGVNWLNTTMSGDTFVIYGQLPAYTGNVDDYEYTVTATAGGQEAKSTVTVSVEEDDADNKKDTLSAVAGTMAYSGEKSINLADRNYEVVISFTEDYYDSLSPEDIYLPYWLVAVPTLNRDDEVTGYTIKFREGAKIPRDASGVVRFEDPDTGDIVTWDVTFDDDTTEPVDGDFFTILPAEKAISLKLNTTENFDLTVEGSVKGELSYTSSAPSWVTVTNEGKVTVAPTDASLVSATPHTVTITATDSGRTGEGSTQTVTLTVTVTPADEPEPVVKDFKLTANGSTTLSVKLNGTDTSVTLKTENVEGTVSYTPSVSWVTVDPATGKVTVAPTDASLVSATPHTVTIKAVDNGHKSGKGEDEVTLTITVTDNSGSDPDAKKFSLTVNSRFANGYSFDISNGTISLDVDAVVKANNAKGSVTYEVTSSPEGLEITLSGKTAVINATKAGDYTLTIKGTDTEKNTATATIKVTVTGNAGSSSSGGGCDAGFGALALALAAPLFLRRRRS